MIPVSRHLLCFVVLLKTCSAYSQNHTASANGVPNAVMEGTLPGLVTGAQGPADIAEVRQPPSSGEARDQSVYDQMLTDSLESVPEILEFSSQHHQGLIKWTPAEPLHQRWYRFNRSLRKRYGLDLGIAYTTLYQKASSGLWYTEAAGGDIDFFGVWTLADKKQKHPSSIGFLSEQRHKFTTIPPSRLGENIGSLWKTANTFNVQDYALVQLWWEYQFINDKIGYRIGKLDLTDYFNLYKFISVNYSFINEGLSANITIPFPPNGFAFIYGMRPIKKSLLLITVADLNARKTSMSPDTFFTRKEYFSAIEFKWMPKLSGLGAGNYNAMLWYADSRKKLRLPSGWGFSFVLEQELRCGIVPFVRYGFQEGGLTDTKQMISSGFGILEPFKRKDDQFALGFVWGKPYHRGKRDQFITEIFYRLQLTPHLQVTPDLQLIIHPSNNPKHDTIGVFSIRARLEA